MSEGVVVAVDAGGSKTDAVALSHDGQLLASARGAGASPHFVGLGASVTTIADLVIRVAAGQPIDRAHLYVSGIDLPVEIAEFEAAVAAHSWARSPVVVDNDLFALLRTGTEEPDAVAVICGTGINAVGVRIDGATARFPALGPISGDWGGGSGLGESALWHAARDVDRRGGPTLLTALVPAALGLPDVTAVTEALHFGRIALADLSVVAPSVFAAAKDGDEIAGSLIDRQADEIVAFATACLIRLDLLDRDIPVVLGGGIIRAGDERLLDRVHAGLATRAPHSRIVLVDAAPIVGAGLLALTAAGASPASLARARAALEHL